MYLNDILIYSPSIDEHVKHVLQVRQYLLENRLFINAEKCEFHKTSIAFLGYTIESKQVRADPEKIRAVTVANPHLCKTAPVPFGIFQLLTPLCTEL